MTHTAMYIFHVLVLGGSVAHYLAVLRYLA